VKNAWYFGVLKTYATIWSRFHCKIIVSGHERLHRDESATKRPRIYVVSHPTTWDLPILSHISKYPFCVVVASDPFASNTVQWLFGGAGFLKLDKDNGDRVIEEAAEVIREGKPLIISLKGMGTDFGEDVRPRTGGIRIARAAKADIYPVLLMIEDGKRIIRQFRKKGESYPYSVFHNTLYFARFLEPIRYEDYAREEFGYEECKAIAFNIDSLFTREEESIREDMRARIDHYSKIKRRGGSDIQVEL
jgi:1-acyl-sn-glycerol-3-phosphate acyltransferase